MSDTHKFFSKTVDNFDENGFLAEYIEFDSTGTKIANRLKFTYDSIHRIVNEIIIGNYHFDEASNKFIINDQPDTTLLLFVYDTTNHLIIKTGTSTSGKVSYACTYNYKTFTETDTFLYSNGYTTVGIAHVDLPFIEKDIKSFYLTPHGDSLVYAANFKNVFDKSGNIKKRTRTIMVSPVDFKEQNHFYFRKERYAYMQGGLLINKTSDHPSNHSGSVSAQLFDYKFW